MRSIKMPKIKGRGGVRPGAGRHTDRRLSRQRPVYLFADQLGKVSPQQVRALVDDYLNAKHSPEQPSA